MVLVCTRQLLGEEKMLGQPSKPTIQVYTAGVFDLFHLGHLRLLERAAALGGSLTVGVSTDELVESYKNRRPVVPYEERSAIVGAIGCVTRVVPQEDRDKFRAWQTLRFDVWVVGDDWKGDPFYENVARRLMSENVQCHFLPYTAGVSTTERRRQIEKK